MESVKKALEGQKMSTVIAAILGGTVENRGRGSAQMHGPGGEKRISPEKKDEKVAELAPSLRVLTMEL